MQAIEAVATPGETAALCHSVGVSRATLYRHRRPAPPPPRPCSGQRLSITVPAGERGESLRAPARQDQSRRACPELA